MNSFFIRIISSANRFMSVSGFTTSFLKSLKSFSEDVKSFSGGATPVSRWTKPFSDGSTVSADAMDASA